MLEDVVIGGLRLATPPQENEYLCYFLHRWLDFRIPDVESAAELAGCGSELAWSLPYGGNYQSPFWYVHLPSAEAAEQVAKRTLMARGFFEVWGEGETWEELEESISSFPEDRKEPFLREHVTYKIMVDMYGKKCPQEEKIKIMDRLDFVPMQGKANIKTPDVTFWLLVSDASNPGLPSDIPYRMYFCREVAMSDRSIVQDFALSKRGFLGPTSMDAEMAFHMCNQAQVKKGSFTFDPFLGTGSVLIAAAHHGAYTMGTDIDYKLIRYGKLDASGGKHNIWSNFAEYGLKSPLGVVICDVNRLPFRGNAEEIFDALICDPPYGVRAGARKLSKRDIEITDRDSHISKTEIYSVGECCRDLLDLAAKMLKIGGRLVYFVPTTPETASVDGVPQHPMMEVRYSSIQILNSKYSRRLVTMKKILKYDFNLVEQYHQKQGAPKMAVDGIHGTIFTSRKEETFPPRKRIERRPVRRQAISLNTDLISTRAPTPNVSLCGRGWIAMFSQQLLGRAARLRNLRFLG
ncbi:hypothetical protein BSKO_01608 [Bryopsis sp. KO-2023]|nr:hypothetical protein BSKO_01608 [Bryopsis sp. KO-2023]